MISYQMDIDSRSSWLNITPSPSIAQMPFRITEAGKFFAHNNFFTQRDGKNAYLFLYTFRGKGTLQLEEGTYQLEPGTAVFIDCRQPHLYKTETGSEQWYFYWLHLDGEGVAAYNTSFSLLPGRIISLADPANFSLQIENLLSQNTDGGLVQSSATALQLHQLLHILLSAQTGEHKLLQSRAEDIRDAALYIQEHSSQNILLEDLANRFALSKYYFIRLFRQHTGVTPYEYLLSCRINKAKTILGTTKLSVEDIGAQVGFTTVSNFIHHFKRIAGVTPVQFRNNSVAFPTAFVSPTKKPDQNE